MKQVLSTLLLLLSSTAIAEVNTIFASNSTQTTEWRTTLGGEVYTRTLHAGQAPVSWSSTPDISSYSGYAKSYTVSMWLDVQSLIELDSAQILFAYYGLSLGSYPTANAIVWDPATQAIYIGSGEIVGSGESFSFGNQCVGSDIISLSSDNTSVNITLAVAGESNYQQATIYVNGEKLQTLQGYAGNLKSLFGSQAAIALNSKGDLLYNEVRLADCYMDEAGVVGILGLSKTTTEAKVPEPATGSLSLLALAGLCARRRRK